MFIYLFILFCSPYYCPPVQAEAAPHHQTEDARRLAHRAISYRPASHAQPAIKPAMMTRPTEAMVTRPNNEAMMTRPTSHVEAMMRPSEEHAKAMMTRPTSHAEAMIRPSEDHAKAILRPSEDLAKAPVVERADSGQGSSNSSTSPTTSLDMVTGGLGSLHIQVSLHNPSPNIICLFVIIILLPSCKPKLSSDHYHLVKSPKCLIHSSNLSLKPFTSVSSHCKLGLRQMSRSELSAGM